jgi:hypothetical protein
MRLISGTPSGRFRRCGDHEIGDREFVGGLDTIESDRDARRRIPQQAWHRLRRHGEGHERDPHGHDGKRDNAQIRRDRSDASATGSSD